MKPPAPRCQNDIAHWLKGGEREKLSQLLLAPSPAQPPKATHHGQTSRRNASSAWTSRKRGYRLFPRVSPRLPSPQSSPCGLDLGSSHSWPCWVGCKLDKGLLGQSDKAVAWMLKLPGGYSMKPPAPRCQNDIAHPHRERMKKHPPT